MTLIPEKNIYVSLIYYDNALMLDRYGNKVMRYMRLEINT